MKISIISPVYENKRSLDKFLQSVEAAINSLSAEREVLIVDDGSSSDMRVVTDKYTFVKYVKLPQNAGPAIARNTGAEAAGGDYLIFFDSDVMLKKDTLKLFESSFKSGEDIVVGEYDKEPIEKGFFPRFKAIMTKSWTPKTKYVSVFALRAAGIKKSIFNDIGGFDQKIKSASVEDFEFGDRLLGKGYKIAYNPDILVYHHHPSFKKQFKLFYERSRDLTKLLIERRFKPYDWCASPAEGVSSIFGTLFVMFFLLALVFRNTLLVTLCALSFLGFVVANAGFLKAAISERKIFFLPMAILVKMALCLPITAGFVAGYFLFIKTKLIGRNQHA